MSDCQHLIEVRELSREAAELERDGVDDERVWRALTREMDALEAACHDLCEGDKLPINPTTEEEWDR